MWAVSYARLRRYAIEHGSAKVVIGLRWDVESVIGSGIGLGGGSEDD